MNKTSEHLQVNTLSTAKKQWIKPKAEVISNDTLKGGTFPGAPEGQLTHSSGGFYQSHS